MPSNFNIQLTPEELAEIAGTPAPKETTPLKQPADIPKMQVANSSIQLTPDEIAEIAGVQPKSAPQNPQEIKQSKPIEKPKRPATFTDNLLAGMSQAPLAAVQAGLGAAKGAYEREGGALQKAAGAIQGAGAAENSPYALLNKDLDFKNQSYTDLAGQVLGTAIGGAGMAVASGGLATPVALSSIGTVGARALAKAGAKGLAKDVKRFLSEATRNAVVLGTGAAAGIGSAKLSQNAIDSLVEKTDMSPENKEAMREIMTGAIGAAGGGAAGLATHAASKALPGITDVAKAGTEKIPTSAQVAGAKQTQELLSTPEAKQLLSEEVQTPKPSEVNSTEYMQKLLGGGVKPKLTSEIVAETKPAFEQSRQIIENADRMASTKFNRVDSAIGNDKIKVSPEKAKEVLETGYIQTEPGKTPFENLEGLIEAPAIKQAVSYLRNNFFDKLFGAAGKSGEGEITLSNEALKQAKDVLHSAQKDYNFTNAPKQVRDFFKLTNDLIDTSRLNHLKEIGRNDLVKEQLDAQNLWRQSRVAQDRAHELLAPKEEMLKAKGDVKAQHDVQDLLATGKPLAALEHVTKSMEAIGDEAHVADITSNKQTLADLYELGKQKAMSQNKASDFLKGVGTERSFIKDYFEGYNRKTYEQHKDALPSEYAERPMQDILPGAGELTIGEVPSLEKYFSDKGRIRTDKMMDDLFSNDPSKTSEVLGEISNVAPEHKAAFTSHFNNLVNNKIANMFEQGGARMADSPTKLENAIKQMSSLHESLKDKNIASFLDPSVKETLDVASKVTKTLEKGKGNIAYYKELDSLINSFNPEGKNPAQQATRILNSLDRMAIRAEGAAKNVKASKSPLDYILDSKKSSWNLLKMLNTLTGEKKKIAKLSAIADVEANITNPEGRAALREKIPQAEDVLRRSQRDVNEHYAKSLKGGIIGTKPFLNNPTPATLTPQQEYEIYKKNKEYEDFARMLQSQ